MIDEQPEKTTIETSSEIPHSETETGADELTILREQLEAERKQAADNLAGWQRAAADLANFRRRAEQEKNDLIKYGNSNLIRRILPVLDDFERALQTVPDNLTSLSWVEGVLLIERKLRLILEGEGLTTIAAQGEAFDPAYHEAIVQEEVSDPALDGRVLAELQKGYKLNDRVLRPTLVKVGRKKEDS